MTTTTHTTRRARRAARKHPIPLFGRVATIVGILIVVVGIIAACGTETSATASPEPETVTVTETVTETVEVTSQSCLDALDYAESAFAIAADFAGLTGDLSFTAGEAVLAAGMWDWEYLEELTEDVVAINGGIGDLTAQLAPVADGYKSAAAECRSGS